MKKLLTAMVAVALLVGCNNSEPPLKQTRDDSTFTMTVQLVTADKITQKCTELGVQYEANGCATFDTVEKHCVIYVAPQRYQQDEERLTIIGHETWHCRFGKWHD